MLNLWKRTCIQSTGALQSISASYSSKSPSVSIKHIYPSPPTAKTSYEDKAPSPFRQPGPRRYGYENKLYTGGLLPRLKKNHEIKKMPAYKPKDNWSPQKALFGQNDYIDILGDGSVMPVDLIRGPPWLIGFKGNEIQRLIRRMRFEGKYLQYTRPTEWFQTKKNIWYLFKKFNHKRSKRH